MTSAPNSIPADVEAFAAIQQPFNTASLTGFMISMILFGFNSSLFFTIWSVSKQSRHVVFVFATLIYVLNVIDVVCQIQIVNDTWSHHITSFGTYININWYLGRAFGVFLAIMFAQWSLCYRAFVLYNSNIFIPILPFLCSLGGFIPNGPLAALLSKGNTSVSDLFNAATLVKTSLSFILVTDVMLTSLISWKLWSLAPSQTHNHISVKSRERLVSVILVFVESACLVDAGALWELLAYTTNSYSHQTAQNMMGQLYGIASLLILLRTATARNALLPFSFLSNRMGSGERHIGSRAPLQSDAGQSLPHHMSSGQAGRFQSNNTYAMSRSVPIQITSYTQDFVSPSDGAMELKTGSFGTAT